MKQQINQIVWHTAIAASLWLVGCGASQPTTIGAPTADEDADSNTVAQTDAQPKRSITGAPLQEEDGTDVLPVDGKPPLPPIDRVDSLQPHTGLQLKAANQPYDELIKTIDQPDYLTPENPGDIDQPLPEPPIAAQRAYILGRQALRNRQTFEARRQFELALTIAPKDPHLLRVMGQLWAQTGNRTRSVLYLEKAFAADPSDLKTLYLLGRHALDQGRWNVAIATFDHAINNKDTMGGEASLWSMVDYFLANALERRGNDGAFVQIMTRFLDGPDNANRSTDSGRQLMVVNRQRGLLWQSVGDAHMRLGNVTEARAAYKQSAELDEPTTSLAGRRIYAALLQDDSDQVNDILIEALRQDDVSSENYRLVRYVAAQGLGRSNLAEKLKPIYLEQDRSSQLAIAITSLLDDKDGFVFLRDHLAARPQDQQVFDELLKMQMKATGNGEEDSDSLAAAVRATMSAMEAAPQQSDEFAKALMNAIDSSDRMLQGINNLPKKEKTKREAIYLHAMALLDKLEVEPAQKLLEQLVKKHPDYQPARIRLAVVLVAMNKFEKADTVLAPLSDSTNPTVVGLRVAIYSQTGRQEQAIDLLDQLLQKQPNDVSLVLQKANLQLATKNAIGAERTLLDALQSQPREEKFYEMLFQMYDKNMVPDAIEQYKRLMHRMLGAIPESRLARLKLAEFQSGNNSDQAERLLQSILVDNPNDAAAVEQLVELYRQNNHKDKAEQLITEKLKDVEKNPQMIGVAIRYYNTERNQEKVYEVLLIESTMYDEAHHRALRASNVHVAWYRYRDDKEALQKAADILLEAMEGIEEQSADVALGRMYAHVLVEQGKLDEAEDVLQKLLKKYPDDEADLMYFMAVTVEHKRGEAQHENMLAKVLEKYPEHSATLNGLGYGWANDGRHLDRAEQMIQKALKIKPNESAYLDSLGWVYYKKGDFEKAVEWLQKSVDAFDGEYPVILDHLGDALYKLDRPQEAQSAWSRALLNFAQQHSLWWQKGDDPELEGIDKRLNQKIQAVRQKKDPPVAEVVEMPQPEEAAAE